MVSQAFSAACRRFSWIVVLMVGSLPRRSSRRRLRFRRLLHIVAPASPTIPNNNDVEVSGLGRIGGPANSPTRDNRACLVLPLGTEVLRGADAGEDKGR